MNKWSLFACLAGVLAMGAGCTSSVEDVRCEVRPAALQFDRAGGTESIEVDASVAWQYEMEASAETWLTVTATPWTGNVCGPRKAWIRRRPRYGFW